MSTVLTPDGTYRTINHAAPALRDPLPISYNIDTQIIELLAGPDGAAKSILYGDIYRANPWLFACVQYLARGVARNPCQVFDTSGTTKTRVEASTDTRPGRVALALRRPSPGGISSRALWTATAIDRHVRGNALWRVHEDRTGITGFEHIPWRHVRYEKVLGVRTYTDARTNTRHIADDVCHFGYGANPDNPCNDSPIAALHGTIALWDAVQRHLRGFFKNGANPSGHLKVPPGMSEEALTSLDAMLTRHHSSPDQAGRTMYTSGDYTPISATPDHSKVIELSQISREEVCAAYGVPPPLIGILERAIMSNVRELREHSLRDVLGPHSDLLQGDLDAQVFATRTGLEDVEPEFNYGAALRPDLEARAASYRNQRYIRSVNEIRALENLPRIEHPDADLPAMPLSDAPIGRDSTGDTE